MSSKNNLQSIVIKKLGKNHWQQWREIRLEALKKSPDSFLSSFEEEDKTPSGNPSF
jgi:hypothetical protein